MTRFKLAEWEKQVARAVDIKGNWPKLPHAGTRVADFSQNLRVGGPWVQSIPDNLEATLSENDVWHTFEISMQESSRNSLLVTPDVSVHYFDEALYLVVRDEDAFMVRLLYGLEVEREQEIEA